MALGTIALPAQHTLDEEAPDGGERAWIARQEQAQFERNAEHPLSHGNFGKNSANQMRSRPAHSPGVAGGAGASALARERDEEFPTTELADRAQKPKGVNPALEEGAKLLLHVRWETSLMLLAGLGEESLQMLSHELREAFERAPCQASLAPFQVIGGSAAALGGGGDRAARHSSSADSGHIRDEPSLTVAGWPPWRTDRPPLATLSARDSQICQRLNQKRLEPRSPWSKRRSSAPQTRRASLAP